MVCKSSLIIYRRVFRIFVFFLLILLIFILASPVSADTSQSPLEQTSVVCEWNGVTYYPGQYFYNSAGQQFLCYSDGTYHFTGVTMIPAASTVMYPYTACSTSCDAVTCYTTCSQSSMVYPYRVYYPYYSPNVLTAYPYSYFIYPPSY